MILFDRINVALPMVFEAQVLRFFISSNALLWGDWGGMDTIEVIVLMWCLWPRG